MKIMLVVQDRGLQAAADRFAALAEDGPAILAGVLNAEGMAAREKTVAAETAQTGLKHDTLQRAQHAIEAGPNGLSFTITSQGGNVRLRFFGPHEGGGGVTATPWNRATYYGGAFLTSGRAGARRMVPKLNGQVFERATSKLRWNENRPGRKAYKSPIRVVRSGLFIPDEMTKGQTLGAFEGAVSSMADRIVTRLGAFA